jgi:hypothetical protein
MKYSNPQLGDILVDEKLADLFERAKYQVVEIYKYRKNYIRAKIIKKGEGCGPHNVGYVYDYLPSDLFALESKQERCHPLTDFFKKS